MPREQMDERQVAAYLHLDLRQVQRLASRGQIPCRRVSGRYAFMKGEVDHWVEVQMHELGPDRMRDIERGVSNHHGMDHGEMLVCPLIPPGGIVWPLQARTRDSAIRELVNIADQAGLVCSRENLIREVLQREDLCSTALMPHTAIPHPRHPLPYDIAASFVVVGGTASGIPFGATDGALTQLFFLICCKDDRTHLHVLARIAQMLAEPRAVSALLAAESCEEIADLLQRQEAAVLEG